MNSSWINPDSTRSGARKSYLIRSPRLTCWPSIRDRAWTTLTEMYIYLPLPLDSLVDERQPQFLCRFSRKSKLIEEFLYNEPIEAEKERECLLLLWLLQSGPSSLCFLKWGITASDAPECQWPAVTLTSGKW